MENATEALKMAAAVLIFVLALSISIGAYGQARQTAQIVLDYKDREYDYTYVPFESTKIQRKVGIETIVPSMYKAYKENYKVVFRTTRIPGGLYAKKQNDGTFKEMFSIDLEKEIVGSENQKEKFIQAVLYGADPTTQADFLTNSGIRLKNTGIYDIIKGYTFTEKLGVYYQEEADGRYDSPNANKTLKRVITYED